MDKNQTKPPGRDKNNEENPDRRNAHASNDPSHHQPAAGITNRPLEEEEENQERLPPRGNEKE